MVMYIAKYHKLLNTISNIPSRGINDQVPINRTINHFQTPISNTTPSYSQQIFTTPLHHLRPKNLLHTRICCHEFLLLEHHLSLAINSTFRIAISNMAWIPFHDIRLEIHLDHLVRGIPFRHGIRDRDLCSWRGCLCVLWWLWWLCLGGLFRLGVVRWGLDLVLRIQCMQTCH